MKNKKTIKKFFRLLKDNDAYDIYMVSIVYEFKIRLLNGDIKSKDFLLTAFRWGDVEIIYNLEKSFWKKLNDEWIIKC